MFFRKKQSLIGLDIGSHTVKVVEIETLPKGGHRLVNYGISEPLYEAIVDGEIMDRQLVTDAIANLLEIRGIKTKHVVAAVSGRAVIVKKIAMNKLSQEDAQQAIRWEAEQHVPYDINDVSLDFEIAGAAALRCEAAAGSAGGRQEGHGAFLRRPHPRGGSDAGGYRR